MVHEWMECGMLFMIVFDLKGKRKILLKLYVLFIYLLIYLAKKNEMKEKEKENCH